MMFEIKEHDLTFLLIRTVMHTTENNQSNCILMHIADYDLQLSVLAVHDTMSLCLYKIV